MAHSARFVKCIMTDVHHCSFIQWPEIFCALPVYPSTPQPSSSGDLFLSLWKESVIAQLWSWLLSLSHVHLRCSVSFRGLTAHFFLALSTTPLSRWTTVRFSTHCQGTSYCFKILTVVNKSCKCLCARMYGDVSFQLLWVDTKEHDCWIVWSEYGEFLKNLPGFHSGRTMVLLYIPTSNDWEFSFHILTSIWCCQCSGYRPFP